MTTKLDHLRAMTGVVADTGDVEAVRRLKPQDCTTNPTLILKAAEMPAYAGLLAEALAWGQRQGGTKEAVAGAVCDRLAVAFGAELSRIVPGRVSTEVDADLSFDTAATVAKGRAIIEAYGAQGIPRERILIKIASTWEGIRAAEVLQREGIDCNLTLLFGLPQAMAAADAKAFLISPFVGRILDWHIKAGGGPYTGETDPGVLSVRRIYAAYKAAGVATVVMGASFRNRGEIEALAGCDRLTIAPALLDELAADTGPLPRRLSPDTTGDAPGWTSYDEPAFRFALNEDAMATEKLAEGIRQFAKDFRSLRNLVAARLEQAA
ncbi:MAG TPA: transaldolase [Beijerinckiaceae bacterium]